MAQHAQGRNYIDFLLYYKLKLSYKVFRGLFCTPVRLFFCNYENIVQICEKLVFIFKNILKMYI